MLFLKGTLQQYAGRLHRLYEGKREVRIYDYIDVHVPMLEKMYHKRLAGYAAIGYKAKTEITGGGSRDIIFDSNTFLSIYQNDLLTAAREILIVSPFLTRRRVSQMLPLLVAAREQDVKVVVVTRPATDFREKDRASLEETLSLLRAAVSTWWSNPVSIRNLRSSIRRLSGMEHQPLEFRPFGREHHAA
jgi:hypothetical protein